MLSVDSFYNNNCSKIGRGEIVGKKLSVWMCSKMYNLDNEMMFLFFIAAEFYL